MLEALSPKLELLLSVDAVLEALFEPVVDDEAEFDDDALIDEFDDEYASVSIQHAGQHLARKECNIDVLLLSLPVEVEGCEVAGTSDGVEVTGLELVAAVALADEPDE